MNEASPVAGDPLAEYRDPEPFHASVPGLELGFYPSGADRLERLLRLIDEAQECLKLAFYIFAPDSAGSKVRDALVAAARRGVCVKLIVDGFGAAADEAFFADLVAAGGDFCVFQPRWSRRYLIRNHQKIVTADGHTAMLGGFNIEDSYFAPPERDGWNDLAVTLRGDIVGRVDDWFDQLDAWTNSWKSQFRDIRRRVREWDSGEGPVRLLIGGPTKGLSSWAQIISRDLIYGEKLDMMMAYFSPPKRLRRRIRRIAKKGQTRLLMAGKSDNGATIGASRLLYRSLLKSGAKIWEFLPCKLHTKLIVLDDAVYLGSANFDMRSLYLNLEIVLRVEDKALAERMREFIAGHFEASLEITSEVHRQQGGVLNRLRWYGSWFLVAGLDYTVSRKLNLGL